VPAEGLSLRFLIGGVAAALVTALAVGFGLAFRPSPDDAMVEVPAERGGAE